MAFFNDKVHLSTWDQDANLPPDWVIAVSKNGWTNDKLGLKWPQEVFDKYTAPRTVGRYRLLILDGHGSYARPEFDNSAQNGQLLPYACPHTHHTSYNLLMWAAFQL